VGMNLGAMNKMMKRMQQVQQELQERTVEGSAGGGSVRVTVSGSLEVRSVEIDPAAIDPEDPAFLADLVAAAVNDGLRRAQAMMAEEMGKITGGLKLPGMP